MLCFILFLAMSHDSITGYVCRPIGLSIGLSVGLFVSPSVGPPCMSVGPLVCNAFTKLVEISW